jgi:maleate isomerase
VHEKVAELAKEGVDLIHPEGAPPFMVHGFKGEEKIVKEWEAEFKIPIVTAAQTQVEALRALNVKKFVGVTYFVGTINDMFTRYFDEAGFEVLTMAGMKVDFADVGRLASTEIYAHTRQAFLNNPGADGIYMLGTGWRCLDIIHLLEEDLQVPVVHAVPARVWSVQKRLHIRQKRTGFGKLLEEMP